VNQPGFVVAKVVSAMNERETIATHSSGRADRIAAEITP
jgi:hypothetical protein